MLGTNVDTVIKRNKLGSDFGSRRSTRDPWSSPDIVEICVDSLL